MRPRSFYFAAVITAAIVSFGCGGSASNSGTAANTSGTNGSTVATTKTPDAVTNNAPTLTPVLKAYCEAFQKNDEAALKKLYTQDTLKHFESEMKDDNEKSFMKFLEDDRVSGTPCEGRNEEINGNVAKVLFVADRYPNGIRLQFEKENGEWKLTDKYADMPTKTDTNSNAAMPPKPAANSNGGKK